MRLLIMSRYCSFFTGSKSTSIGDLDLSFLPPPLHLTITNPDIKINYDSDEWRVCVSPTHDTPINTGLPSFCASVVGFCNTSRFIELNNTAIDGAQRNRVSGAYIIF